MEQTTAGHGADGAGVLAGVRVVELGRRIAAPLVGMLLAEQGAEVVRVVDRHGVGGDPVLDALLARGKTEAALDLRSADGRAALARLVAQADVVVENLAAGAVAGYGLDFDAIRAGGNPGLVSCRIAPFPIGDPRETLPDYEAVAGAAGFLYDKPIGAPRYHGFPIGSVMSGLFASSGIVAALVARLGSGRGQHIDTSLHGANLFAQILQVFMKTGVPRGFLALKMVATPFMGTWKCKGGRYAYLHITLPAHAARMLELLEEHGHGEHVRALRGVLSPETMRDPSQVKSIAEAKEIRRLYARVFLERTPEEWERLLGRELCCIAVRTVDQWLDAAAASGMPDVCSFEDPLLGTLRGPGPGFTNADRPAVVRPRVVGDEAFAALLAGWEAAPRPTVAPETDAPDGPPLAGVRVADLSRIIAGPCAARVLAELGADVTSVQSPGGLDWALSFHLVFNAGKRSVTLDFKTDEGKRRLWALLDDIRPDVFLQNYRNLDVARDAGIDPDAVRGRYPKIVYTHLNAYGNAGEWRDRPGFEQVVQAVTGIQLAYGQGGRPKLLPTPVIDIGSGLLGAFGTLVGLYNQRRNGEGLFAATHLTRVAVLLQLENVAASQRESAIGNAESAGVPVAWDPDRQVVATVARALDAFVCVAGPRGDVRRWLVSAGLAKPGAAADGDALAAIGGQLWRRPVALWRRSLAAAGVDGSVVILPLPKLKRLVDDTRQNDTRPLPGVRKRTYEGCPMDLTFVRSPLDFGRTPLVDVVPPPPRGADTRAALARIGEEAPEGAGLVPYPPDKPFVEWALNLVQWGWFAWRSGII